MNKETQHGPPRSWTSAASSRRAGPEAIPGEVMNLVHREKLKLCFSLESIADALPNANRLKFLGMAKNIVPLLRAIHGFEETVIFPAY
ncbi:hemerythrin domain-containing protein [Mesorhizobium loti]|uniref:hemerythrin domain-containing protein n=1 Tax=Rhizobium loti TaxID=381 RepID=UPI000A75880D|nr:hemerythrin domain-containing protein [Mesorhizobium loti]